jgi:hypothetical protein
MAGVGQQVIVAALIAVDARKAMAQVATSQESFEYLAVQRTLVELGDFGGNVRTADSRKSELAARATNESPARRRTTAATVPCASSEYTPCRNG